MDPHRNIFYYYSGGKKHSDQIIFDQQLENNTTKALINTLENSSPVVTEDFINNLLKVKHQKNFQYNYGLQRRPLTVREAKIKVLLCISPDKTITDRDGSAGGILDAWIYDSRGNIVVAIESKIKGGVTTTQVQGHLNSLGWKTSETKVVHLNWVDVYTFLIDFAKKGNKDFDLRFLQQGIQYLEYIGMDKFTGFKNEDFDYFSSQDADYRPILKKKIEKFRDCLKLEIDSSLRKEYKDFYVGNLGKSSKEWAWVAIKRLGKSNDSFLQCNYTVEIKSEGLEINVVFRNGRHTDIHKPIGVLYSKIEAEGFSAFKNILKKLGSGAYIELFARKNRQGGNPRRGNEVWYPVLSLELGSLTDEAIMHLKSLMREVAFPGIHIGYRIRRGTKQLSEPDLLFKEINTRMISLKPTLDFILE